MRGKIRDVIPLVESYILSLEVDDFDESLMGKDLAIDLKKWSERRSLSANAYFHVLCGKLAKIAEISLTEAKNRLVADYGQYSFVLRNGIMEIDTVCLRSDIEWTRLENLHLSPTGEIFYNNGEEYIKYHVMRPTHTLDSSEMAILIEGTVNECKQVGIKTLDDYELERIIDRWEEQK